MDMWVEDTTRNEVHQIFSFLNIFQEMYVGWCNNGLHCSQMLNEGDTIKFNRQKKDWESVASSAIQATGAVEFEDGLWIQN